MEGGRTSAPHWRLRAGRGARLRPRPDAAPPKNGENNGRGRPICGLPLDHRRSKSDCDWTPVEDEGDHTPSTDLNSASPFPQSPVLNTWVSSCSNCGNTGDAAEADAYLRDPGSEASQAWLEAQLAPGGGGPTPPGSPAYGDDCYFSHPDSPVRRPREEAPDDSDAYELDQERALELQGRISLFYGRPWDEVPRGATVPVTCEWTIASFSRQQQMQRPLSPAPVATDFDIEDKFLQERARWFRDHGGGGELEGSTRKQNERFDRCHETSRIFPRTEQTFASARSFGVIS